MSRFIHTCGYAGIYAQLNVTVHHICSAPVYGTLPHFSRCVPQSGTLTMYPACRRSSPGESTYRIGTALLRADPRDPSILPDIVSPCSSMSSPQHSYHAIMMYRLVLRRHVCVNHVRRRGGRFETSWPPPLLVRFLCLRSWSFVRRGFQFP